MSVYYVFITFFYKLNLTYKRGMQLCLRSKM
nr:MAG TPA: hypothetical protein [Caudoviricetes sp.]DAO09327.1 MAG TPA: hypothetical protein [Caudoviricetes sp.]DAO80629.1 MAG TPA: hypothetical protein [Caudoviricetes sp.]